MSDIKSKSGRSKDVRRMYHRDTREQFRATGKRLPMRRWARDFTNNMNGVSEERTFVGGWLVGKNVEVYA